MLLQSFTVVMTSFLVRVLEHVIQWLQLVQIKCNKQIEESQKTPITTIPTIVDNKPKQPAIVVNNNQSHHHSFIIIGYAETVFPEKFGTPRQGTLCPTCRGRIRFNSTVIDAKGSLFGLEGFSHVWILFLFSDNTNKAKQAKRSTLGSKIRPPQAGGERIGVFASRSPHRPNPIGLTLCKIARLENDILHLEGVDLVDGTPIIDVKPYVTHADQPQGAPAYIPSWVTNPDFSLASVEWTPDADVALRELSIEASHGWYDDDMSKLKTAVEEIIALDPRDVIRDRGKFDADAAKQTVHVRFAGLRVYFHAHPDKRAFVVTNVCKT